MRGLVTLIVVAVGSLCLTAILIGMDVGDDNSDETVRVSNWADDTCGAVGAWEGQIQVIADGVRSANAAARQNDGGSGDSVEWTFFVRTAITRTIQATDLTLQEGLKRAGIPDVEEGERASLILRGWAQETKDGLRSARATLEREADSTTAEIEAIGYAASVLAQAQVEGREAFEQVAALDSELEDALTESDRCADLRADRP